MIFKTTQYKYWWYFNWIEINVLKGKQGYHIEINDDYVVIMEIEIVSCKYI